MKLIEWSDKFSVGVESMDQQHMRIIAMINELIENPQHLEDQTLVSKQLETMISYALEHFELEEKLLKENDYPDFDSHHAKHLEYGKKLGTLCAASFVKDNVMADELLSFLGEWWIHHILEEDMRYAKFLQEK